MRINDKVRQSVRCRANYLCEYCHSPESSNSEPLTLDHLIPRSKGGSDEPDNLALACRRCNERRYNFVDAIDPKTRESAALFNPRSQVWNDHFVWAADALSIVGKTPTGRATCQRLDINDKFHTQGFIQSARELWIGAGWHPPLQDDRLTSTS